MKVECYLGQGKRCNMLFQIIWHFLWKFDDSVLIWFIWFWFPADDLIDRISINYLFINRLFIPICSNSLTYAIQFQENTWCSFLIAILVFPSAVTKIVNADLAEFAVRCCLIRLWTAYLIFTWFYRCISIC